jgi:HK97 family phage prohead protease
VTERQMIKLDVSFAQLQADVAEEGFIKGIASTPSIDSYGHKVLPGAFDKSIQTKGLRGPRGVKLLMGHDWDKPVGVIKRLETRGNDLSIEAQLALGATYVRDLYEVTKMNGGLSFSVGFFIDEEEEVTKDDRKSGVSRIISQGDLAEVSVVTFPAQVEAEMTLIKQAETMAELEKALVAQKFCQSRGDAHRMVRYLRANKHLLLDGSQPSAGQVDDSTHPLLDASTLKPLMDYAAKCRAILST